MINEKKDKELFNEIAYQYTRKDIYPVSRYARKFQLESLIELTGRDYFNGILELGCGPGYSCVYLKNRYNHFTGIDYSEKFIEIANQLNLNNTTFLKGNIKNFSNLKIDEYDLILGIGILHHVDDIEKVLNNIKIVCNKNTILAFIEPYSGNPIIQILRKIRKRIDKQYSDEQIFFKKKDIIKLFNENGFSIDKIAYQGYISTPFAQVILKPIILFYPICKFAVCIDKIIQKYLNIPISWNIIWTSRLNY